MHFYNVKYIWFTIITYSPVAYLAVVKMLSYFFYGFYFYAFHGCTLEL